MALDSLPEVSAEVLAYKDDAREAARPRPDGPRLLALADAIERAALAPAVGFNMASYASNHFRDRSGHDCRTVACIAGWAAHLSGNKEMTALLALTAAVTANGATDSGEALDAVSAPYRIFEFARDWLGLDGRTATELFIPGDLNRTPAEAALVLRTLAYTGRVRWP